MSLYDLGNDSFPSPPPYHTRKPSSRSMHLSNRKSSATLRKPLPLDDPGDNNDSATSRSLAHELAVALMPEPSVGSMLLAEELGLEFDEGAEGIDESVTHPENGEPLEIDGPTFADGATVGAETLDSSLASDASGEDDHTPELDPEFDNLSPTQDVRQEQRGPDQDMMEILARDLESNSRFIGLLQKLDTEFTVERIASDTIRRINETVRDREGQVRELLEYEREFRKIAGEVGGSDALSNIDVLENLINEDEPSVATSSVHPPNTSRRTMLETLDEEPLSLATSESQDWEVDPNRNHLGDEEDVLEPDTTISKLDFPSPPPLKGPLTPAKTIPQLSHLRTLTASFVTSLASCSEQAQVNGAGLTDTARKIRSLKHKISGLYSEWDSMEQSRQRIEKWESGTGDGSDFRRSTTPTPLSGFKRVDGRKVVQEHLRAFELALADASTRTQAIMAR
ncbi:hypothetical protein M378DRAFT_157642 [Amanita muscaria Koide BX008]|uniref:Uncharacterized protein n=1 Tax=Amanita muscaria (strain Koide BX008) TaxID=946122 RepID=A0A0C2TQ60_AMAMK|nr:hypothetical protein M378DRAFT_157642 [Amanita muscaria Koide BX008]